MLKNQKANIHNSLQTLVTLAILIAAQVVISQFFMLHLWNIKISLTFIPVIFAARFYGALGGATVAGMGDILGCIMHPVGAWFPPITIQAIIVGALVGLLFKNSDGILKIVIYVLTTEFVFSLFGTTLWLSILYGSNYWVLLVSRIIPISIMAVIKFVIAVPLFKAMDRIKFTKRVAE